MGFRIIVFLTGFLFVYAQQPKVPSTKDIEDYDDPVLREIFKTKTEPQRFEPDPTPSVNPYGPQQPVYPPQYRQQPSIYQPGQYPYYSQPNQESGAYRQAGTDLTNLAAQGATNFYTGAQRVGQAFGFQGYETPLISTAAGFLG
uniref:Uncharacterized protein n=1 Tax=Panagrolaimus sp. JU765 TaxID=591449 RepID=A0AC34RM76_9BILA